MEFDIDIHPELPKGFASNNEWYLVETLSGNFYTPFMNKKKVFTFAGDGSEPPTPKQIVEELNSGDSIDLSYQAKVFFNYIEEPVEASVILPGGYYIYKEETHSRPERLVPFELRTDTCINLGDVFEKVQTDINNFLANEEIYRKHGIIYKQGILMFGLPGNGKTGFLRRAISETLPPDSVIIFIEGDFPSDDFLLSIKNSLGDRLKVFVFEELAAELDEWYIGRLLNFLDGELSIDRSICLATTNYPEKLPANIVDRPSRFDKLYEFGNPKEKERALLFSHFLGREVTEEELLKSKDLSIASIKEASLLELINKIPLVDAISEMKKRSALCKKAFSKPIQIPMGFGSE